MRKSAIVSVIVPAKNEEDYITECLLSLMRQDYPQELYDVVVVDDHSTDQTVSLIKEMIQRYPHRIKLLKNEGMGGNDARMTALKRTKTEFVIQFTAHGIAKENFISTLMAELEGMDSDVAAVGCRFVPHKQDPTTARAIAVVMTSLLGAFGTSHFSLHHSGFVEGLIFAVWRKSAINQVGGFTREGGDAELNAKLRQAGYRLFCTTKTTASYRSRRTNLRTFFYRLFQYGLGRATITRGLPSSLRPTFVVPSIFTIFLLISPILLLFLPIFQILGPLILLVGLAYCSVVLASSWFYAVQYRLPSFIFHLSTRYVALHLGYGIGFIEGWLRKTP
jgi:glycosyltransferase involved in cell wall biosynthesis